MRLPIISRLTVPLPSVGVPKPCPKLPLGTSGDAPATSYFAIRLLSEPGTMGDVELLVVEGDGADCLLRSARRSASDILAELGRTGGALHTRTRRSTAIMSGWFAQA